MSEDLCFVDESSVFFEYVSMLELSLLFKLSKTMLTLLTD